MELPPEEASYCKFGGKQLRLFLFFCIGAKPSGARIFSAYIGMMGTEENIVLVEV